MLDGGFGFSSPEPARARVRPARAAADLPDEPGPADAARPIITAPARGGRRGSGGRPRIEATSPLAITGIAPTAAHDLGDARPNRRAPL